VITDMLFCIVSVRTDQRWWGWSQLWLGPASAVRAEGNSSGQQVCISHSLYTFFSSIWQSWFCLLLLMPLPCQTGCWRH